MTYMNTSSAIYNSGIRSSAYNKIAIYNTNARATMSPRKTSYSLDLRKQKIHDINTKATASYHTASSTGMSKNTSKTPYQAATNKSLSKPTTTATYQLALNNNTVTTGTNTTQKTYNLDTRQLDGLPPVTLNAIAKLIAPQQVMYNVSTGAESFINQKATSTTARPSNSPSFNISAESTVSRISPDSHNMNKQPAQKKVSSGLTVNIKPSECQISADASHAKSTTTELPLSSTSSTSSTSSASSTSTNRFASTSSMTSSPTSDRFARPTGAGNVFVKTRPNTVVRAELIKNKTTKRAEAASSVCRVKEDEYKSSKKPKPAFKTKLVNKYCTYYHKYGRCKEGDFCAYKHDPKRVEVCKLWLKGIECTLGSKCPLQHVESAHLIPYCRHFCKGMCLKDDCHYTHVKVSKRAPHCKDFMVGRYCPAGTDCRKKHEWGLYEEPTETESDAGKKHDRDPAEDEVEREKIKKLREEMANGVNPFAAGWTFIPIDD